MVKILGLLALFGLVLPIRLLLSCSGAFWGLLRAFGLLGGSSGGIWGSALMGASGPYRVGAAGLSGRGSGLVAGWSFCLADCRPASLSRC